jgi:hypothetical protein
MCRAQAAGKGLQPAGRFFAYLLHHATLVAKLKKSAVSLQHQ